MTFSAHARAPRSRPPRGDARAMTFELVLHATGALLCAGLAAAVVWRDRRSFVHRVFALGMTALAAEAALTAQTSLTVSAADALQAERLRLLATALLPGPWLL